MLDNLQLTFLDVFWIFLPHVKKLGCLRQVVFFRWDLIGRHADISFCCFVLLRSSGSVHSRLQFCFWCSFCIQILRVHLTCLDSLKDPSNHIFRINIWCGLTKFCYCFLMYLEDISRCCKLYYYDSSGDWRTRKNHPDVFWLQWVVNPGENEE